MPPPIQRVADIANPFAPPFGKITWTISVGASGAVKITGQVADPNGNAQSGIKILTVYLSDVATGIDITATGPTGTVAVVAKGKLLASIVSKKVFLVQTDVNGAFDLTLPDSGTPTWYPVAVTPWTGVMSIGAAATVVA